MAHLLQHFTNRDPSRPTRHAPPACPTAPRFGGSQEEPLAPERGVRGMMFGQRVLIVFEAEGPRAERALEQLARNIDSYGHLRKNTVDLLLRGSPLVPPLGLPFRAVRELGPLEPELFPGLGAEQLRHLEGAGAPLLPLLFAAREAYDHVLLWDGAEHPVAAVGPRERPQLAATDVLGAHLSPDADLTLGFVTGYTSPLPGFDAAGLSPSAVEAFSAALQLIAPHIDPEPLLGLRRPLRALASLPANRRITDADEMPTYQGNLCIRVAAIREGRLPAFHASPGGAVETLGDFSHARVMGVPAGSFRDTIGEQPALDRPELPTRFEAPEREPEAAMRRFGVALRSAIAQAPLRVHLQDGALAWVRLAELSIRLRPLDARLHAEWPALAALLPGGLSGGLDAAIRRLPRDVAALEDTRRLWGGLWGPRGQPRRGAVGLPTFALPG